jgi:polyhydroxybutyrate depolymerase
MVVRFLLAALLALAALPARADTITTDGVTRTFTVTCPTDPCRLGMPVIFVFHGHYQTAASIASEAQFEAHHVQAIMVYPLGRPMLAWSWNAGADPPQTWAEINASDDVGFVEAIINYLYGKYQVDRSRVFAAGLSNGGQFAWELACTTERFAAIATVAGTMNDPHCPPESHPPILVISGTADTIELWQVVVSVSVRHKSSLNDACVHPPELTDPDDRRSS